MSTREYEIKEDVYAKDVEDKIIEIPEFEDDYNDDYADFGMSSDSFRNDW